MPIAVSSCWPLPHQSCPTHFSSGLEYLWTSSESFFSWAFCAAFPVEILLLSSATNSSLSSLTGKLWTVLTLWSAFCPEITGCSVRHCLLMAPLSLLHSWLSSSIFGEGSIFISRYNVGSSISPFCLSFCCLFCVKTVAWCIHFSLMFFWECIPLSMAERSSLAPFCSDHITAMSACTSPLFFSGTFPFFLLLSPCLLIPVNYFCKWCTSRSQSHPLC